MTKQWYIYRHRKCYVKIFAESLEVARLLMFTRHRKDFYYFKYIGVAKTKKDAKRFCYWNKKTIKVAWIKIYKCKHLLY